MFPRRRTKDREQTLLTGRGFLSLTFYEHGLALLSARGTGHSVPRDSARDMDASCVEGPRLEDDTTSDPHAL